MNARRAAIEMRAELLRRPLARVSILAAQIFGLWLMCRAGDWVVARLGIPLPGNVLGMLILFFLLAVGLVKERWIQDGSGLLTRHLAFFFVPIAVGLMEWGGLFWRDGHWLSVALVVSTLAGLLTTGAIAQAFHHEQRQRSRWIPSSSLSPSPSPSAPMDSRGEHSRPTATRS